MKNLPSARNMRNQTKKKFSKRMKRVYKRIVQHITFEWFGTKIRMFLFYFSSDVFNICASNNSGTDELFLLAWQAGLGRAFLCGWSLVPVQLGLRLFYISYNDDVARLQSELEKQPHKYHLPNNVLCQKNIWYCRYYLTKLLLKPCMQMKYNVFMVSNRFLNVNHRTCSI